MKPKDIVKEIMRREGVGIAELGRRMGMPMTKANNRLTQSDNATMKSMVEYCDALDYKIVIMPKGGKTPKGGYEVDLRVCEGINDRSEE